MGPTGSDFDDVDDRIGIVNRHLQLGGFGAVALRAITELSVCRASPTLNRSVDGERTARTLARGDHLNHRT